MAADNIAPGMAWLVKVGPVAADVIAVVLFLILAPLLQQRFSQVHPGNMVLLLAAYLICAAGVYLVRMAQAAPAVAPGWIGFCSVCFGVFITVAAAMSAGWFREGSPLFALDMDNGRDTLVMVIGALIWLALVFLQAIALYCPVAGTSLPAGARPIVAGLGAFMAGLAAAVTAAWWAAQLQGAATLALRAKLVAFLPVLAVMMLFYAPPRLLVVWVVGDKTSWWTFALSIGIYVWRML